MRKLNDVQLITDIDRCLPQAIALHCQTSRWTAFINEWLHLSSRFSTAGLRAKEMFYLDGFVAWSAGEEGAGVWGAAVVAAGRFVDGRRRQLRRPRHALDHVLVLAQFHLITEQVKSFIEQFLSLFLLDH